MRCAVHGVEAFALADSLKHASKPKTMRGFLSVTLGEINDKRPDYDSKCKVCKELDISCTEHTVRTAVDNTCIHIDSLSAFAEHMHLQLVTRLAHFSMTSTTSLPFRVG